MNDRLSTHRHSFAHLSPEEKRDHLQVLSNVVWDIEAQLAKAKADQAALMNSLQADMHQQSAAQKADATGDRRVERTVAHGERPSGVRRTRDGMLTG